MNSTLGLPLPKLSRGRFASVTAYTDERLYGATGVRIAFTERSGGVSKAPYDSLDLAEHVDDDPADVAQNRALLMRALQVEGCPLIVPKQVHGDKVVTVGPGGRAPVEAEIEARCGADAIVVTAPQTAALLCFADCVPLVLVAPSGHFAVVHAGWRGVENGIAVKALKELLSYENACSFDSSSCNIYRGAYIHASCFETSPDIHARFVKRFGDEVAYDATHIDLGRALDLDLKAAGVDEKRIADVGCCTVCDNSKWYSYRAQGGVCGRHGAFAVRREENMRCGR